MDSKNNTILKQKQIFLEVVAKFCDKCGTPYAIDDLNIVQNTGMTTIIHFSCHNCKAKHIATFIPSLGVSQRVPVNTDLGAKEIGRFSNMDEISLQEILNLYTSLKKDNTSRI